MASKYPPSRHRVGCTSAGRTYEFTVHTRPIPKGRPRLSRFRVYTPQRTLDYEATIAQAAADHLALFGADPMTCPVRVELRFQFAGAPRTLPTAPRDGDVDNLVKSVLDALNGVVFADDRQVVAIVASKCCGDSDSVHVRIEQYVEMTVPVAALLN